MTIWIPMASEIADLAFLLAAAAIAYFGVERSSLERKQKDLLFGAMLLSVLAKVLLANLGHNYDLESYRIVSDIQEQGQSVYASTTRYNYGPIWAWIVSGFGHLASADMGERMHMWIAAFLGMVDVLIAVVLLRAYSLTAALVFVLSPVGLLISGYHSQFDNLAVLLGLLAWLLIREGKPNPRAFLLSAVCLGLSLIVKHVLFLFPLWMVFWRPLGKLRNRILYALIAYGMFACAFLPWLFDPLSRAGILRSVLGYSSGLGFSWVGYIIDLFPHPEWQLVSPWVPSITDTSWISAIKLVWMAVLAASGVILARKGVRELYLFYLLLLYASTPSLANQYEAIPLVACAVFWSRPEGWSVQAAATFADFMSPTNLGPLLQQAVLYATLPSFLSPYFMDKVIEVGYPLLLSASQFCAAMLLLKLWRQREATPDAPPLARGIWQAAYPIVLGGVPAAIKIARVLWAQ